MPQTPKPDDFTPDERRALAPYFTTLDGPVFALVNLPETVKGALFARYSRSAKSLRRLFLDEFIDQVAGPPAPRQARSLVGPQRPAPLSRDHDPERDGDVDPTVGVARAERLYARVFGEYGDDSVAQLGGVHLACEGVSNVLTKILEWGRLMAYLEQSTRYVPYTARPGGRWKYLVPPELEPGAARDRFAHTLDGAFDAYAKWIEPMQQHFGRRYPNTAGDPEPVYRAAIRAKALDTLRGLLPAATQSNVGIYGTGQAYEALLLRMRASTLGEVRHFANLMLDELRKVIPAFLTRVDQPERGGRWSAYLAARQADTAAAARRLLGGVKEAPRPEVRLTDFDPDGEVKVVAAALYAVSDLPDDQLLDEARRLSASDRAAVLAAAVGDRANRRHKPGRAFERTSYRFDLLTDYGAFRDLQRHRMLTLDWQPLSTRHGYTEPDAIREAGALDDWQRVMDRSAELYESLAGAGLADVAPYAVAMAYRVRFYLQMNAREAMHLIELRTAPQGHPAYRRVCQAMHRLIAEEAGHAAIAAAMAFADHSAVELERLEAERSGAERRAGGKKRMENGE